MINKIICVAFKGASRWSLYFVAGDICVAENRFLMNSLKTLNDLLKQMSVGDMQYSLFLLFLVANHADVQRKMFHPDTLCNLNLSVLKQDFVKQQLFEFDM